MKLSEEVIAILDNVCAKFGVAVDWTSENVVPYLTELAGKCVKYELVTSILCVVVLGAMWVACFIGCYVCIKRERKAEGVDSDMEELMDACAAVLLGTGCVVFCIWLIIAVFQAHDIIACLTFPEKVILPYIKAFTR